MPGSIAMAAKALLMQDRQLGHEAVPGKSFKEGEVVTNLNPGLTVDRKFEILTWGRCGRL